MVIKHSRKTSLPTIDQKSINMGIVQHRKGSGSMSNNKQKHIFIGESTNDLYRLVPYKKAINLIETNIEFMTKEQIKVVKVFPMREWHFQKGKKGHASFYNDSHMPLQSNWKRVVIVIIIVLGSILVMSFLFTFLS